MWSTARLASFFVSLVLAAVGLSTSCTPEVDCGALCARTLACEVTFGPTDDPEGQKITSGERTDDESCAVGCEESPLVTVDNARCIDALQITSDPEQCQQQVMDCLGLEDQL
jgi:hypothetical protein